MISKRKLDQSVFFIVLIVLIFVAMVVTGFFYLRSDVLTDSIKNGKIVKILFVFSDQNNVKFLETFFYNPKKQKGGIFYIPANVGSRIESLDKNDAISVLYKRGNIGPIKKKIEQLLDTEIPFYIDFSLENLAKAVDIIDGIEIFISNPVTTDYSGRKILLPSGNIILDGDKTVDYIVYEEKNEEERDRVFRKQKFLQSWLKRIGDNDVTALLKNPKALEQLYSLVNTNISKRDFLTLADQMPQFDTEHIYPGRLEGKIFIVEDKELLFPHSKGEYVKLSIQQMIESIMSEDVFDDKVLTISIEILNGTDVTGLASRSKAIFQSYGYDVLHVGNADTTDYEYTVAIDRKGNSEAAKRIAGIIKCDRTQTDIRANEGETPDVTLILGKDFNGSYCKK